MEQSQWTQIIGPTQFLGVADSRMMEHRQLPSSGRSIRAGHGPGHAIDGMTAPPSVEAREDVRDLV